MSVNALASYANSGSPLFAALVCVPIAFYPSPFNKSFPTPIDSEVARPLSCFSANTTRTTFRLPRCFPVSPLIVRYPFKRAASVGAGSTSFGVLRRFGLDV